MTTSRPAASHAARIDAALAATDPALQWARTARFLTTSSQLDQLPAPSLPEVAFVGRSNAGKSTAINTLAQHKRLAFASKTPGRTQHINLFELGPTEAPDARWADLPGYGYAAVARGEKLRWQKVMADYLAWRHALAGLVMMVDSRHGFTALDLRLLDFVRPRVAIGEVPLLVLLTKADKLSKREAQQSLDKAQAALGEVASEDSDIGVLLFSALDRRGVDEAVQQLYAWRAVPGAQPVEAGAESAVDGDAGDRAGDSVVASAEADTGREAPASDQPPDDSAPGGAPESAPGSAPGSAAERQTAGGPAASG